MFSATRCLNKFFLAILINKFGTNAFEYVFKSLIHVLSESRTDVSFVAYLWDLSSRRPHLIEILGCSYSTSCEFTYFVIIQLTVRSLIHVIS